MKVLTYVNGTLTVISGDNYFNNEFNKPEFITGENFYFEPTLKIMDNVELSEEIKNKAIEFIDNFDFNSNKLDNENIIEDIVEKFYVDIYGNFVPKPSNTENLTEIPCELGYNEKWNFTENKKYVSLVIEKSSLRISPSITIVDDNNKDLYFYVDAALLDNEVCSVCQFYNLETNKFEIIIPELKNKKISSLSISCLDEIKNQGGDLGNGANAVHNSWLRQELEAEAWKKDNNTPTPFIDNILIGRNLNEDKEFFINKIIDKANSYKEIYGKNLGKLSAKIKEVEASTTKEEILNIKW